LFFQANGRNIRGLSSDLRGRCGVTPSFYAALRLSHGDCAKHDGDEEHRETSDNTIDSALHRNLPWFSASEAGFYRVVQLNVGAQRATANVIFHASAAGHSDKLEQPDEGYCRGVSTKVR
jgi:hypothetical protein